VAGVDETKPLRERHRGLIWPLPEARMHRPGFRSCHLRMHAQSRRVAAQGEYLDAGKATVRLVWIQPEASASR
jgi:hypothetical protein